MGNKHSSSHEVVAAEVGSTSSSSSIPPTKLLHGCTTLEEHNEVIRHVISSSYSSSSCGEEQLKTMGFEYRFVPCCSAHASSHDDMNDICCHQCATRLFYVGRLGQGKGNEEEEQGENKHVDAQDENQSNADKVCNKQKDDSSVQQQQHKQEEEAVMITPTNRQQFIADGTMYDAIATCSQQVVHDKMCKAFGLQWVTVCDEQQQHIRALVDRDHTMLLEEDENRWVVQELMNDNEEKKGDDDDDDEKEDEDSSAMIKSTSKIKPPTSTNRTKTTLLIATGRGKVRAGIFSRHHLLTAGIEVGTSWHCIREARRRSWGVAIIDPNARGENVGYHSFKKSVSKLFPSSSSHTLSSSSSTAGEDGNDGEKNKNAAVGTTIVTTTTSAANDRNESSSSGGGKNNAAFMSSNTLSKTSKEQQQQHQKHSIYILAHSASGGQLVRHLREDNTLLPSIAAIAFTDSTHNVQWCKHDPTLQHFLQAKNCVYLRSNDVRSSQSCVKVSSRGKEILCDCTPCVDQRKAAGMLAQTDNFWTHRFGNVKTLWAGTSDHALCNWTGHKSIWSHFDEIAGNGGAH